MLLIDCSDRLIANPLNCRAFGVANTDELETETFDEVVEHSFAVFGEYLEMMQTVDHVCREVNKKQRSDLTLTATKISEN